MKIKWLGHACFLITSDNGTKLIIDPFVTGGNLQYGEIDESADIVAVTHEHRDHNNPEIVRGNPEIIKGVVSGETKGIKFRAVASFHDNIGGVQRGANTMFNFEIDGIKVCHLGDLGHLLNEEQAAGLGKIDILIVPIGGYFTIDAEMANNVCDRLKPRVIIPMHFKTERYSGPIVNADEFLQGKKAVTRLDTSEVEFSPGRLPDSLQIIVLHPAL